MGHEYVEMKNSHAAIEAYRKAVGTCSRRVKEFNCWTGAKSPSWRREFRCQPQRLQGVVWPCTGLRTTEHASVCSILLPTCDRAAVSLPIGLLDVSTTCSSSIHQTIRRAHLAGSGHVLRRDGEVSDFTNRRLRCVRIISAAVLTGSLSLLVRTVAHPLRLREAIECLKRSLIGADPQETIIHQKLAKLHNDLEDYAEAAAYHSRIVEVCRAARESPRFFAPFSTAFLFIRTSMSTLIASSPRSPAFVP